MRWQVCRHRLSFNGKFLGLDWAGPLMHMIIKGARLAAGAALLVGAAGGAQAQTAIQFDGAVVATCIISISTPGALAMNTLGTEIGSEHTGGTGALLSVTATGGAPKLSFTAPSLALKPGGYSGSPTVSIRYSSTGGANQGYTSNASFYTSTNALGDTVTLHAKAADSAGYKAGNYRVQTTVTCSQ